MLGGNKLMNKFLRVFGLGLMIATFAFVGFAQERTREVVYNEYMANFQSNDAAKLQVALKAAKEYVEKFNTPDDKEQVDYFKGAIPTLEAAIKTKGEQELAKKESDAWYALLGKVTAAVKAENWADAYSNGKQAIDKQFTYLDQGYLTTDKVKSEKLDLAIVLGTIGFDLAAKKTDTYNSEAVNYLKSAIQQIEGGQTSTWGKVLGYDLKNKDNALGLMNYYIGYIMYYRQKKEEEAMSYLYKATQFNSASRDFSNIYNLIGLKFYNKLAEMDKIRIAKTETLKNEQDEAAIAKLTEEIKALVAEEKGVAERGIEAFAKALDVAKTDKAISQKYKDDVRANIDDLYKFRFPNKPDGVDAYINTVASRPLTNPATPVQPIVEEETSETTDSKTTSTTPSTKPATTTNGTKTSVKPTTTEAKTTPVKKPRRR